MTPYLFSGHLAPASFRPPVLEDVPAGWERPTFDPSSDGDLLAWLGFEPGEPGESDEPLLLWARPATWPVRRPAGLRRMSARLRTV